MTSSERAAASIKESGGFALTIGILLPIECECCGREVPADMAVAVKSIEEWDMVRVCNTCFKKHSAPATE